MKKLVIFMMSALMFLFVLFPQETVYADDDAITALEFNDFVNSDGKASIKVEEGMSFSVLSDLTVMRGNSGRTGFIEEISGLTYSSSNTDVVKVVDKELGVFETLSSGKATITVTYSKKVKVKLTVKVVSEKSIDTTGEYRSISEDIAKLYKKEIKASNVISYYNKLKAISDKAEFITQDQCLLVANEYQLSLCYTKLDNVLEENNAIYYSSSPFTVKKVAETSSNKYKLTISRKLTNFDVVAYSRTNGTTCSKNAKMKFRVNFWCESSESGTTVDVKMKAGSKSFTSSIPEDIVTGKTYKVTMVIDDSYGFTITEGVNHTFK